MAFMTSLLDCYIWSVVLHGCETRTISSRTIKILEANEMWFLIRMPKIWTSSRRNKNQEVLDTALTKTQL